MVLTYVDYPISMGDIVTRDGVSRKVRRIPAAGPCPSDT